jgi:hypothetical protein
VRGEDVADFAQRGLGLRLAAVVADQLGEQRAARLAREPEHQRAAQGALHLEEDPRVVARDRRRRSRIPSGRAAPTSRSAGRPGARAHSPRDRADVRQLAEPVELVSHFVLRSGVHAAIGS